MKNETTHRPPLFLWLFSSGIPLVLIAIILSAEAPAPIKARLYHSSRISSTEEVFVYHINQQLYRASENGRSTTTKEN